MKISLLAPARWVPSPLIEQFVGHAARFDFDVEVSPQNALRDHQLAGSDAERAAAFEESLGRPDIDVVWCARGGYGAGRILPLISRSPVRRPLILAGYSDFTALQMALLGGGAVGLSAAMPIDLKAPEKVDNLEAAFALCRALLDGQAAPAREFPVSTVRAGAAHGRMVVANLAVLTRLIGTPYWPDLSGAILCVEDVGEYLYAIDRMFLHLQQAGAFETLAGLVLGEFVGNEDNDPPWGHTVEQIAAAHYAGPIATGLPFGHGRFNQPLTIGAPASLVCDGVSGVLTVDDQRAF